MNNKQINVFSFAAAVTLHSALLLFNVPSPESHVRASPGTINLCLETIPASNPAPRQKKAVSPPKKANKPSVLPTKNRNHKKNASHAQVLHPMNAEDRFQEETGTEPQLTASSPAASDINSYLSLIRSQIEQHKYYPHFSRKQDHEGTVFIKLDIAKDGSVVQATLLSSSGYNTLDEAALDAVRQSSPFPAPSDYGLGELSLDIPVCYMLY